MASLYDRVKYYSANDIAYGLNMGKIEKIYPQPPQTLIHDINDVIELYNIKLYFDDGIRSTTWSDANLKAYSDYVPKFTPIVFSYFNKISDDTLSHIIKDLYKIYQDDFWFLFDKTKLYEHISDTIFPVSYTHLAAKADSSGRAGIAGFQIAKAVIDIALLPVGEKVFLIWEDEQKIAHRGKGLGAIRHLAD